MARGKMCWAIRKCDLSPPQKARRAMRRVAPPHRRGKAPATLSFLPHLPTADVHSPLAKYLTSAYGRCAFPHAKYLTSAYGRCAFPIAIHGDGARGRCHQEYIDSSKTFGVEHGDNYIYSSNSSMPNDFLIPASCFFRALLFGSFISFEISSPSAMTPNAVFPWICSCHVSGCVI